MTREGPFWDVMEGRAAPPPSAVAALVLAGLITSLMFGWQRAATGGVLAPALTHVTWSVLMLRYLPPLFRDADRTPDAADIS